MKDVIGIMKCKSAWFADFKVRTMKSVNENDKDKIGWVGIKDNGDEYHVYCKHWDFEPVSKWKYLKGSEKDFDGAPEWSMQVLREIGTENIGYDENINGKQMVGDRLFWPDLHGHDVNSYRLTIDDVNSLSNVEIIAQREPITTADVEVVKYDPTKVDIESLVTDRGNRYGKFADGAKIMRSLKGVMHNTDGWSRLTDSQKEALDMIQHKIGRILNGDPAYDDNWKDIAGYSKLIADELNGEIK
ncbi:hypothetical protein MKK42_17995 [Escherichia coli]|uniref:hypothetical protein n=1 Tax=Escherichia coli TaxID=562 RepID=UPI001F561528|nr:hypothetical protein [Escherichia coli]MCI2233987.1 hypothetical protein [Escherichia coli]